MDRGVGFKRPTEPDLPDSLPSDSKRLRADGPATTHGEEVTSTWPYLTDFGSAAPSLDTMSLDFPLTSTILPQDGVLPAHSVSGEYPGGNGEYPGGNGTTAFDPNLLTQLTSLSTWSPLPSQQEIYLPPELEWNRLPVGSHNSFAGSGLDSWPSVGLPLLDGGDVQQYAFVTSETQVLMTQQGLFDDVNASTAVGYAGPEAESFAGTQLIGTSNTNSPFPFEPEVTIAQFVGSAMPSPSLSAGSSAASVEETPEDSLLATPGQDDAGTTPGSSRLEVCNDLSAPAIRPDSQSQACQECDVCFGVIVTTITSSCGQQEAENTLATILPLGNVLKVSILETGKYVGIIKSEPLAALLKKFTSRLTATLLRSSPKAERKRKSTALRLPEDRPVRVVVYGLAAEKNEVAALLSDGGLYFQHPLPTEYDRMLPYSNPHYLLRPGSQMPDLHQLSISGGGKSTVTDLLDDVSKGRLMRIFDTAQGPEGHLQIRPSPRLKSTLKSHQLSALAMMAERESGIVEDAKFPTLWAKLTGSDGTAYYRHKITGKSELSPLTTPGGILADDMGLGKTLSLLALVCWSLDSASDITSDLDSQKEPKLPRSTLIVAPKSTIPGWQNQITRHIRKGQLKTVVYHGSSLKRLSLDKGDVILTTYETLRSDWLAKGPLCNRRWLRVVLDEAHRIRTRSAQLFKASCAVDAQFRWCLTGTPIQNALDDYGALLSFIGVDPFREKSTFDSWIASPLKANRPNCTRNLEDLVRATCLRRTKQQVQVSLKLPSRTDRVELVELDPMDRALYQFFKRRTAEIAANLPGAANSTTGASRDKGQNILRLINFLRLICNHGERLLPLSALEAWRNKQNESIGWEVMRESSRLCNTCELDLEQFDMSEASDLCPSCNSSCADTSALGTSLAQTPSWEQQGLRPSAKIRALVDNLRQEQKVYKADGVQKQEKSVVFSYWTKMLDLVEQALKSEGIIVQRIDGQCSLQERASALHQFDEDPCCTVMLASICSAGEGIDLTAANHIHLLEPQWNPMIEVQAMDRVHRIGQIRNVTTTRYITLDSIETYVQWIQADKMRLINQALSLDLGKSQPEIEDQRWKKLQNFLGPGADADYVDQDESTGMLSSVTG